MSHIVSKQSLDVLANLTFTQLQYDAAGEKHAQAYNNLDGSSAGALYQLLRDRCAGASTNEEAHNFVNAFATGAEFGIAVAAAILTHQHDFPALNKAVRAELRHSSDGWPEELRKIPEAA